MGSVEMEISGHSVARFLGVTETLLKDSLTADVLTRAADGGTKELAAWVRATSWTGLPDHLARHLMGLLQQNGVAIFVGAWMKCAELMKCLHTSRFHPEDRSAVELLEHEFEYALEPRIEVHVDGKRLGEIPFSVDVTCAVQGLALEVLGGKITRVRSGRCEFNCSIGCAGQEIWHRPLTSADLPGVLTLGGGLALDAANA